jgi:hypothetical protein
MSNSNDIDKVDNSSTSSSRAAQPSSSSSSSSSTPGSTSTKRQITFQNNEMPDFLLSLDSYASTVPEAVARYYMETSGVNIKDPRLPKLLALAADKFLAETIFQAREIAAMRIQNVKTSSKRKSESLDTLEIEDLESSLAQQRIHVCKRSLHEPASNKDE